jgi:hypothetical protein
MVFTLWNPTSLQCLLHYEIVKCDRIVADSSKITVGLIKMYIGKVKILDFKIKLYIYKLVERQLPDAI